LDAIFSPWLCPSGASANLETILPQILKRSIPVKIMEARDGIFEGVFNVHVHSAQEVNQLCAKIAKVDGVSTVHRSTI
ncbi:MAG: ACT domain-containing protein, partial [Proteiniphilum sp.]